MPNHTTPIKRMLALLLIAALIAGSADRTRDPLAPPAGRLLGMEQTEGRLDALGESVTYRSETFAYETPFDRQTIVDFYTTAIPSIGLEFACEPRAAARLGGLSDACGGFERLPFDWRADLLFRDPRPIPRNTITISVAAGPGRPSLVTVQRTRALRAGIAGDL